MLQVSVSLRALVFVLLFGSVAFIGSDVAHGAPSAVVVSDVDALVFNNPGPNGSRDIRTQAGGNTGGIRIYTGDSLTNPPTTAALQFFGNGHTVFPGQAFIDSGVNANAAILFRTAASGGVAERMRINASGNVKIGNPTISGCVNNGLCVQSSITTDGSMTSFGHIRTLDGVIESGNSSNTLCNGAGDLCADDDVAVDDDVHVVGQVRVGIGLTIPTCSGDGNVCAAGDIIAQGRVKTGTVDSSCSIAASICAGGPLVTDEFVSAGEIGFCATAYVCAADRVIAGTGASGLCNSQGDVCAFDDLVAVDEVVAGSGCVRKDATTTIAGTCSSDARLKRNIEALPSVLSALTALQPVSFDWRWDEFPELNLGSGRAFGLIAQDVEAEMPELVTEKADGFKAVHYERLPLLMLQGMRELKAENDAVNAENSALKDQVQTLEARLAAIEQMLNGGAVQLVATR